MTQRTPHEASRSSTPRSKAKSSRRNRVRSGLVALGLLASVAAVIALLAQDGSEPVPDASSGSAINVSNLRVDYFDGSSGTVSDYAGKPLVVNFYASWCGPCLKELPGFEQVHQRHLDDVTFLGVNLQDRESDGLAVAQRTGITYDLAHDGDGSLFFEMGGFAMPTTLFIDENGGVIERVSGEMSPDTLDGKIKQYFLS